MNKYANGKIYTIRNKQDETLIYVGSTIVNLCARMSGHKQDALKNPNRLFYSKVHKWDDWYIELYENYPCNNVEELRKREGEVIRQIGTLNKRIAGRTEEEYRETHKEEIRERDKKYKENNKEKIKERKTAICECECGKTYQHDHKASHQKSKWHLKFLETGEIPHYKTKEEIKEIKATRLLCECGIEYQKSNKARHEKNEWHLEFIKNGNNLPKCECGSFIFTHKKAHIRTKQHQQYLIDNHLI